MIDYKKYFPYEEMRLEQEAVLKQIAESWDSKKYFILQLDVGVGKSGIAKAAANWSKNAFIITETKQLQQQYLNDFSKEHNMVSIKGKANYPCNRNTALNCENGPCMLRKLNAKPLPCKATCKYYALRKKALASQTVLTSYAYIFRAFDCAGFWKPRQLMVFDECHLIEDQLVNFASFNLNPVLLFKRFGIVLDDQSAFTVNGWESNKDRFYDIYDNVVQKREELFKDMEEELGDKADKPEDLDEDTLDALKNTHILYYDIDKLYKKMEVFTESDDKDSWIIESLADGTLQFTPLYVNSLFKKFCNSWADKFIFMSATILDTEGFIKDLGIDEKDCLVIKQESSFDPSKSPIYFTPCGSMNYQNIDSTLPKACSQIQGILARKKNEKGIIHTSNYKVARYLYDHLKDKRLLMKTNDKMSNQQLIKTHERSKNSVLLSPSMTTGVDLKDDLSRFQIIVKMPFSSLADPRIKRKADIEPKWYACQMLKTLVQACGRSTRSADDYSVTYILDSSFTYWIHKYKDWLPEQFKQRIMTK